MLLAFGVTVSVADGAAYDVSSTAGSATMDIADDDNLPLPSDLPAFHISDGIYNEGDVYGYYLFYVILNKPVAAPVRVSYDFEPTGTGPGHATEGQDYKPIGRNIYFRAGITQNAGLLVITDDNKEPDEIFRITLTSLNPNLKLNTDAVTNDEIFRITLTSLNPETATITSKIMPDQSIRLVGFARRLRFSFLWRGWFLGFVVWVCRLGCAVLGVLVVGAW